MYELIVTLPTPPGANGFYSVFRGRKILSKRARLWRAQVAPLLEAAQATVPRGWPPGVTYAVTYWYTPASKRVSALGPDLDGPLKALMDACTQAQWIWRDDSQVMEVHAYKLPVARPGGITIKIVPHHERAY
jgi:crossover junction endodeoxyribonuclease RusA